jgi:hypothetical protein
MGCYNEIIFKCPNCNSFIEEQSKGGDCSLSTYAASEAPLADIAYLEDNKVFCSSCKKRFIVKIKSIIKPYLVEDIE